MSAILIVVAALILGVIVYRIWAKEEYLQSFIHEWLGVDIHVLEQYVEYTATKKSTHFPVYCVPKKGKRAYVVFLPNEALGQDMVHPSFITTVATGILKERGYSEMINYVYHDLELKFKDKRVETYKYWWNYTGLDINGPVVKTTMAKGLY